MDAIADWVPETLAWALVPVLVVLVASIVVVLGRMGRIRRRRFYEQMRGTLVATALLLPGTAGVIVVIWYLATGPADERTYDGVWVYLLGTSAALALWLLTSWLLRHLASVQHATPQPIWS